MCLTPRQDHSMVKICVSSGDGWLLQKERASPSHALSVCVFPSLQQCPLLFIKDYISFSAWYPRLSKKAFDGLTNCPAHFIICLVFLTKRKGFNRSVPRCWAVSLANGKLLKMSRSLTIHHRRATPQEGIFQNIPHFTFCPLIAVHVMAWFFLKAELLRRLSYLKDTVQWE